MKHVGCTLVVVCSHVEESHHHKLKKNQKKNQTHPNKGLMVLPFLAVLFTLISFYRLRSAINMNWESKMDTNLKSPPSTLLLHRLWPKQHRLLQASVSVFFLLVVLL